MIIHKIEQGSEDWHKIRQGKITGSKVKQIGKSTELDLVDLLIAESVVQEIEESYTSYAMQRGKDMEPFALEAYKLATKNEIEIAGFCQSDLFDWLGFSPDALTSNNTKVVEIKCPDTKNHVKYIRMDKVPADYLPQCLLPFIVSPEIVEVDFVSYDPRFTVKPMHIITITRDSHGKEILELQEAIHKFYKKFKEYYDKMIF